MVGTNDFLEFADGGGANVIDQATYAGLAARTSGFQSGIAESNQVNKVWRQAAAMAHALGQIIADGGGNALDNADPAALIAAMKTAIATPPTHTVLSTGSGTYTPPANCVAIHIEAIAGGGGGGGTTGVGQDGAATTIAGMTCNPGHGGAINLSAGLGGSGGGGSSYFTQSGATGQDGFLGSGGTHGGQGAASFFGGGGTSAVATAGGPGVAFGSGGGGAGQAGATNGSGGGGAGEYRRKDIARGALAASYGYTVGAGGNGGTGTNTGGGGAPGSITITEYYG